MPGWGAHGFGHVRGVIRRHIGLVSRAQKRPGPTAEPEQFRRIQQDKPSHFAKGIGLWLADGAHVSRIKSIAFSRSAASWFSRYGHVPDRATSARSRYREPRCIVSVSSVTGQRWQTSVCTGSRHRHSRYGEEEIRRLSLHCRRTVYDRCSMRWCRKCAGRQIRRGSIHIRLRRRSRPRLDHMEYYARRIARSDK